MIKERNQGSLERVTVDRVATAAALHSRLIESFLQYWDSKRGELPMPRRRDIDPVDMPSALLPYLILVQIERAPFRVLYRLVGTNAVDVGSCDFTGYYLDQLEFSAWDTYDWESVYRMVADSKAPYFAVVTLRPVDGVLVRYPWALFPLTDSNGEVTHIMEVEDLPFSYSTATALSGRIKKGAKPQPTKH